MKPILLVAALPLALTACNTGLPNKGNVSTANATGSEVVPDSVTVNGVTYVRAGLDKIAPAASPTAVPAPAPIASAAPSGVTDTGSSVPPNTGSGDDAGGDHGN